MKRGSAAIVGVAESDLGNVAEGLSVIDLMAQGVHRALDDCGLKLKDVDALFSATTQSRLSVVALAEYLGLDPAYIGSTIVGGSSFEYHVAHAMAAISAGPVQRRGDRLRQHAAQRRPQAGLRARDQPLRVASTSRSCRRRAYALAASRHMHQFGTTREQMAAVAVAAREWALLNPAAWEKKPLTIEDVLSARMVSYPFTVRDCCLVTDGGGAIIVTSAERAKSLKKKPAYVLGCGQSTTHSSISNMPDLTVTGALAAGKAAYKMAKLGPADIEVVELYDAFTINTILFLEDLGFCKKGEGGAFVEGGRIGPKGSLAVNTNGGGLSYCHPGMYGLFLLIEAVRQLRGECGARQVKDCEIGHRARQRRRALDAGDGDPGHAGGAVARHPVPAWSRRDRADGTGPRPPLQRCVVAVGSPVPGSMRAWIPAWSRSRAAHASGAGMTAWRQASAAVEELGDRVRHSSGVATAM